MLRIAKIILILTVAAWALVGALFNLLDWGGTVGSVRAATSMSTFDGGAQSWQATTNTLLVWTGALFIFLSKASAGALCLAGAIRMWQARHDSTTSFAAAKELALVGCTIAITMLFFGFIVIAESWYELWRSDALRGPVLESAFRYAGMIGLISLFVGMQEPSEL